MSYNNLLFEIKDNILTILINRPKQLNSINLETLFELDSLIKDSILNDEIRLIVLSGHGDKSFVAGADIKELATLNSSQAYKLTEDIHKILNNTIEQSNKPIIAAINGYALGGGLELAMACHIRIASDNAKFGMPEVSLGLIPGYGGTQRLTHLVGKGRALEIMMTGRKIDSKEALDIGLINYVVKQHELRNFVNKFCMTILANSSNSFKHLIKSVNSYFNENQDGFKTEQNEFSKCFESDDFKEGVDAFLNKRKANFK